LESAARGKPAAFMSDSAKALITPGNFEDDLGRVAQCEWIIEAVAENMEIKRDLWYRVAALRQPGSILSTNTSGIPLAQIADGFERTVWARLQPELGRQRRGWISWFVLSPARLAWVGAVVVLIAGAFFAGRVSQPTVPAPGAQTATAASVREGVLLVDLGDHLDRSQRMLVELVSAGGDGEVNVSAERARFEDLVSDNRLYRQTAEVTGNMALATVLDELERVLVEIAASPDALSAVDLERVRQHIESRGLLFKVRVLSSDIRERQKTGIRMRTGQSS